jgi:hypothetical protein
MANFYESIFPPGSQSFLVPKLSKYVEMMMAFNEEMNIDRESMHVENEIENNINFLMDTINGKRIMFLDSDIIYNIAGKLLPNLLPNHREESITIISALMNSLFEYINEYISMIHSFNVKTAVCNTNSLKIKTSSFEKREKELLAMCAFRNCILAIESRIEIPKELLTREVFRITRYDIDETKNLNGRCVCDIAVIAAIKGDNVNLERIIDLPYQKLLNYDSMPFEIAFACGVRSIIDLFFKKITDKSFPIFDYILFRKLDVTPSILMNTSEYENTIMKRLMEGGFRIESAHLSSISKRELMIVAKYSKPLTPKHHVIWAVIGAGIKHNCFTSSELTEIITTTVEKHPCTLFGAGKLPFNNRNVAGNEELVEFIFNNNFLLKFIETSFLKAVITHCRKLSYMICYDGVPLETKLLAFHETLDSLLAATFPFGTNIKCIISIEDTMENYPLLWMMCNHLWNKSDETNKIAKILLNITSRYNSELIRTDNMKRAFDCPLLRMIITQNPKILHCKYIDEKNPNEYPVIIGLVDILGVELVNHHVKRLLPSRLNECRLCCKCVDVLITTLE